MNLAATLGIGAALTAIAGYAGHEYAHAKRSPAADGITSNEVAPALGGMLFTGAIGAQLAVMGTMIMKFGEARPPHVLNPMLLGGAIGLAFGAGFFFTEAAGTHTPRS